MAKSNMTATEKMELLASLEGLLGCVRSIHGTLSTVMADVSAIRSKMFENPDELTQCRKSLRVAVATCEPMAEEALRSYDQLLEEFVASQHYMN